MSRSPATTSGAADGRNERGAATRQRLLEAGARVFAARGYDGVSTRELADEAGANQAAILYHFGTKEALYVAVAADVAQRARQALAAVLAQFDDAAAKPASRAAATRALRAFFEAFTKGLLDISEQSALLDFIVREQARPGPGFDALYEGYIRALHEHVTRLVAAATGRRHTDRSVVVDAHAVIGMALSFTVARATFLRRTGGTRYSARQVEGIAGSVAELACRALGVDAQRGREGPPNRPRRR